MILCLYLTYTLIIDIISCKDQTKSSINILSLIHFARNGLHNTFRISGCIFDAFLLSEIHNRKRNQQYCIFSFCLYISWMFYFKLSINVICDSLSWFFFFFKEFNGFHGILNICGTQLLLLQLWTLNSEITVSFKHLNQ
jgi:hypothetical protein